MLPTRWTSEEKLARSRLQIMTRSRGACTSCIWMRLRLITISRMNWSLQSRDKKSNHRKYLVAWLHFRLSTSLERMSSVLCRIQVGAELQARIAQILKHCFKRDLSAHPNRISSFLGLTKTLRIKFRPKELTCKTSHRTHRMITPDIVNESVRAPKAIG